MLAPYKVFYLFTGNEEAVLKAGFGASSRTFKKATDRNRIKRLAKEAYRKQKNPLFEKLKESNLRMITFFVYTGRELPAYALVYRKMEIILQRLTQIVHEKAALHS
jgi:ribonuclease P protein component